MDKLRIIPIEELVHAKMIKLRRVDVWMYVVEVNPKGNAIVVEDFQGRCTISPMQVEDYSADQH
jgi:hypothetical protein